MEAIWRFQATQVCCTFALGFLFAFFCVALLGLVFFFFLIVFFAGLFFCSNLVHTPSRNSVCSHLVEKFFAARARALSLKNPYPAEVAISGPALRFCFFGRLKVSENYLELFHWQVSQVLTCRCPSTCSSWPS